MSTSNRISTDCFGVTSPHWNLPFPNGNLTAAEIIAYCPHWLKSVDIIDRFVANGGRAVIVAEMVNEFRTRKTPIQTNSICVMLQNAMRAAGFQKWTVMSHKRVLDHYDLFVASFRNPRETHPSTGPNRFENNRVADPVEFRSLATGIKRHPSGHDALDLTRCVQYAVANPDESWLFPDDYSRLVREKLGGPAVITHDHLDEQAFERHLPDTITSPASSWRLLTTVLRSRPTTKPPTNVGRTRPASSKATPSSSKRTIQEVEDESDSFSAIGKMTPIDGGMRRSRRVAALGTRNMREDSDVDTPRKKPDNDVTATKKRKTSHESSPESDFNASETSDLDSGIDVNDDDTSDDLFAPKPTPKTKRPIRASAQRGRQNLQHVVASETPQNSSSYADGLHAPQQKSSRKPLRRPSPINPAMLSLARQWDPTQPAPFVTPPVLAPYRLVVEDNLWLYASEESLGNREEMLASAFSSTRWNGPRRTAPFRELYRLSDPGEEDTSDWAENIRWAKEQEAFYGVTSWTERAYDLEHITRWRRANLWASTQAVEWGF